MRLKTLSRWLLLALATAWIVQHRRRVASRLTGGVRGRLDRDDARDDEIERDARIWPGRREQSIPAEAIDEAGGFQVDVSVVAFSDEDLQVAADLAIVDADILAEDLGPSEVREDLHKPSDDVDWRGSIDADQLAVAEPASGDAGELYNAHIVPAVNTDLPNNDTSFNEGENWIESLEHAAAEDGPVPERELDMTDTQDEPPHRTDRRDIPVADRGSAGPRGL
jgi:hypothetical protein